MSRWIKCNFSTAAEDFLMVLEFTKKFNTSWKFHKNIFVVIPNNFTKRERSLYIVLLTVQHIYIYYEIVLEVQTTNKHMRNLTVIDTVNQANRITYSKRSKVNKRKITTTNKQ